jgi:hypothetical protein
MLRWLGLSLLLSTGLGTVAWAQGSGGFDGQYVGALALTQIISGDCTKPPLGARYPLTISGGVVRFKYVPRFDTTLTGRVDEQGFFAASAHLHKGIARMTGHIQGNDLTADIVTPSCHYSYSTQN